MKKKVIGISSSIDKKNHCFVPKELLDDIIESNAIPFIIPITDNPEKYIDLVDALILTGGHDINPKLYNEEKSEFIKEVLDIRDESDKKLFFEAKKQNKKIFGICRGMQLINVLMGGSLYQDISMCSEVNIDHTKDDHTILNISNFLKDIVLENELVNSIHHQAVKKLGNDLVICATSHDNVIEAIQSKDNMIFGVQWHPELGENKKIIRAFIDNVK